MMQDLKLKKVQIFKQLNYQKKNLDMVEKIGIYLFLLIKNRPSTPMKLVMGNSYGIEAESIVLDKY